MKNILYLLIKEDIITKLIETKNITCISKMIYDCSSVISLPDISNLNIINVMDIIGIFLDYKDILNISNKFMNFILFLS